VVVLDTNVALDLLLYADPATVGLRVALDQGFLHWVCDDDCAAEFERVLAYPALKITPAAIADLRTGFAALTRRVADGPAPLPLPPCRDPDDQKFLCLAAREKARWLLTRDKELLRLAKRVQAILPELRVCTPASAAGDFPPG
jgi:putative PIN family toxin of toxin-antitoxin system